MDMTCPHCNLEIDPVFGRCRDANCPGALIGHDKTRELLEDFVAWLDKNGPRLCEPSWGEYRPITRDKVSQAINDFVADRARRTP